MSQATGTRTNENKAAIFTDAFSSFAVNDVQKAKEFYTRMLGVGVSEEKEGLSLKFSGAGTILTIIRLQRLLYSISRSPISIKR